MPETCQINDDANVYFVTFTIVEWLPIFISAAACKIVTDSLNFCHQTKGLCTNAFVIMPTHIHAIIFDAAFDNTRLAHTITDFRKFTGRQLSDLCDSKMPACFSETLRRCSNVDRKRRLWQSSRHPEGIHSERFWQQKVNYLHDNPCRKGLVRRAEYWRYSSADYYLSDGKQPSDVRICSIDLD